MPYTNEWGSAELLLEHRGVRVYHAYKDDLIDQMFTYWFMSNSEGTEDEAWDVRVLSTWVAAGEQTTNETARLRLAIELAIAAGEVTQEGWRE